MELQAVLERHVADGRLEASALSPVCNGAAVDDEVTIHRLALLGCLLACLGLVAQGRLALVVDVADVGPRHADEVLGQSLADVVDAGRVGLHHGGAVVDVDDEAGQAVALAMHEAEGIIIGSDEAQGAADVVGRLQPAQEEAVVELRLVEREDTHGDRANLILTQGQKLAVARHHAHPVALLGIAVVDYNLLDGPREDPGVEPPERLLLVRLELYGNHTLSVVRCK